MNLCLTCTATGVLIRIQHDLPKLTVPKFV